MNRALLWSGCRHHVDEVILSNVNSDLQIEVSKPPDVALFTRFRKHFELLTYKDCQHLTKLNLSNYSGSTQEIMEAWRSSVLETLSAMNVLKRDDYKEFAELCLVFLGGKDKINFRKPGALHKACWMAKLLYAIKICLLQDPILHLAPGTITTRQQLPKVQSFMIFATI